MKAIRQLHLYLGSFFAPLLIYFTLSGAWQLYRFNDVPKDHEDALRSTLHALSNPHLHSLPPGVDPRHFAAPGFTVIALVLALGMALTTVLGLILAFRFGRRPGRVWTTLGLGIALPLVLLYLYGPS